MTVEVGCRAERRKVTRRDQGRELEEGGKLDWKIGLTNWGGKSGDDGAELASKERGRMVRGERKRRSLSRRQEVETAEAERRGGGVRRLRISTPKKLLRAALRRSTEANNEGGEERAEEFADAGQYRTGSRRG